MVVIEGIDNAGKSTLCRMISSILPTFQVQVSEGPPKYEGEMDKRVEKYLAYPNNVIYDRHPCVSQPIYGLMRTHKDDISEELIQAFYEMKPIFVYCDPLGRGMSGHVEKTGVDIPEHIDSINDNYNKLLGLYRLWAIKHACIMYRIGDPMSRIGRMIETLSQ